MFRKSVKAPDECPFGITKDRLLEQSLPQKVVSLALSLENWADKGFPVVTKEQLASRLAICKGCEFWDQKGFGNTGKCTKCGCSTQAKLRMATAKCPIDKWDAAHILTLVAIMWRPLT